LNKFSFTAREPSGRVVVGSEEAENADILVARLQLRGLIITGVRKEGGGKSGLSPQIHAFKKVKFSHYGIKEDDLIMFGRQLATAIGSGVPLLRSIDVIMQQAGSKKFYDVIQAIKRDVESGFSFRDALAKNPAVFSNLWVGMVETGEASGNLPLVLDKLAHYLESRAAFKRKIVSAALYPLVLMFVALLAVGFFLVFIVPRFSVIFKDLAITLPKPTQILIFVSDIIRKRIWFVFIGIGGILYGVRMSLKTRDGKRAFDNLKLRLPLLGEFIRLRETEKFCSSMNTLLEAGVPIIYALEIIERASDNVIMEAVVKTVKEGVREGKPLMQPMEQTGFFPGMVTQMVSIGEEIGELDKMFKKIAVFYAEILETQITRIATMFEPVMILFMGLVIGSMVISMFLPIFQIANVSGGK